MGTAADKAHEVRHNPAVQVLGRVGMACYGLVHVLLAWLTAQVVFGDSGEQTDQKGALGTIAETSFGPVLLWLLALGLFAFSVWQFTLAAMGYHWIPKERKRLVKRISAGVRGIIGITLGVAAISIASGSGGGDSEQQQQDLTAKVLELPAGQFLVGLVALGVLAVAFFIARKGVTKSFEEDLDMGDLPTGTRQWVERLGRVGFLGKGIAIAVIGVLLGIAAVNSDPQQSGGLDKALHTLAAQPFGVFLLAVIALGFLGYGVYCFAAARAHKS
ncbi:DUF1206 domain-containing protein [Umezawaea beigongshangensis]|uniref:DUF1206 domain-containing protein n=1 Tax=Umezawaea beigongshangensis TaxID=2780383 RepID=UPI0027DB93B4|nr:DUF1206 domain-containing protein [Umezawaea beigongshangensis]